MTSRTATRRRLLTPLATAALALALAACSATNPITTQADYAPSDGVRAETGSVALENLLVLTSAEGAAGTVLGSVSNDGAQDVEVGIALAGGDEGTTFDVPASGHVRLGPDGDEEVQLDAVPAAPGALVDVVVTSDGGSLTVQVPVLDGTLPEYADLVPED